MELGSGVLNWHPDERRTDRYGTVHLNRNPTGVTGDYVRFTAPPTGSHGTLVAVVLAVRPSSHIGDLSRGLGPTPSTVGEQITLGVGRLTVEPYRDGDTQIGLLPDDGRDRDWLDPDALYRCHNQFVRLEFHPTPPDHCRDAGDRRRSRPGPVRTSHRASRHPHSPPRPEGNSDVRERTTSRAGPDQ